ncbi:MAG: serine/threonine protein kinase [Deltaproteobacteria bacterium]|nr:serine/threonine protein kinase [Deltaproteobacteria bacterium]
MAKRPDAIPTIEKITEEARFLLRTLLRDDLFGNTVALTEAEKLLEPSLSLGFADYCAFLKKGAYLAIDRTSNTVTVTERGRLISEGLDDPNFHTDIALHFASRVRGGESTRTAATPMRPPPLHTATKPGLAPVNEIAGRPAAANPDEDLIAERYVRYDAIGQGSLGTVYRGKDVLLGNAVAIKEVRHVFEFISYLSRDEIIRRLRREVIAQSSLEHPHVMPIHDVDFEITFPYLVTDYAQGGSLKERLFHAKVDGRSQTAIPVDVAMRYLMQIAYALDYAHAQGVVHANLKPENVLFDRMGNVKLTDFGLTRVTEKDSSQSAPVYVGVGAPSYMAPEQLHGQEPVGPAADVYALGIMLYEMLTGSLPGRRSPMPSAVNQEVPAHLDDLFDRMTRDQLDQRCQTMSDVLGHVYAKHPADRLVGRGALVLFQQDPLRAAAEEAAGSDAAQADGTSVEDDISDDSDLDMPVTDPRLKAPTEEDLK